jgi:hypothetical protein
MTAWRREVDRLAQRLDTLDRDGTRGVGVLQSQMIEVAKDVAELKAEAHAWQITHERQHQADTAERTSGRRWLITTAIAALALLVTALALLISIAAHPR